MNYEMMKCMDKSSCIEKINIQIESGFEAIEKVKSSKNINDIEGNYNEWISRTQEILKEIFKDTRVTSLFITKADCIINKFSVFESKKSVVASGEKGIEYLKIIKIKANDEDDSNMKVDHLSKSSAIIILRRVLRNFHKHIKEMYQERTHGNGTIRKEDLDRITIGNEYDVQRILFSLIRPIFPTARVEIADDAGYNSIRYDVIIDEYSVVIEVKCTRKNMTERNLTEELGSDAFHYKADYLFFFIYDKENIIKNVDAFTKGYSRKKSEYGKDVEAIVNQSIKI